MSATGLLALNFCDLLLLVTSQAAIQILPNSLESGLKVRRSKKYSYLTDISEVPHHVLVVYKNLYCSGSLIRSKIVVTAASCFTKMTLDTPIIVKVGSNTMTALGQVIEVLEVKEHEYYGRANVLDNDIALLMLKDHVTFSKDVKKIPLIEQGMTQFEMFSSVRVCGWGSTNLNPQFTNKVLCSDMRVVNHTKCWILYKTFLNKANFCVEYEHEFRLSDNGGSVFYNKQLVGVVSYGANRQKDPFIALITNVTFYNRWINVNVNRFLKKYCNPLPDYEYYYTSIESETTSTHRHLALS